MECGISENRGDSKSNETDGGGEMTDPELSDSLKRLSQIGFDEVNRRLEAWMEQCDEHDYQAHCIIKNYKHYTPREEK